MGIGVSLLLTAVGAILAWAVSDRISGVDLHTAGIIVFLVGIVGLVVAVALLDRWPWRNDTWR